MKMYRTKKLILGIFIIVTAAVSFGCSGDIIEQYKEERFDLANPPLPDTTPPYIVSAVATEKNKLVVVFNEEIDPVTAVDEKNYNIQGNNRVSVLSSPDYTPPVLGSDNRTVTLTLSTGSSYGMQHGRPYTLLVRKVKDSLGNPVLNAFYEFSGRGPVVAEVSLDGTIIDSETSAPVVIINSPEFTVKVSGFDDGEGSYSYSLDDGVFSSEYSTSNTIKLSSLSEGYHTLKIVGRNPDTGEWQDYNMATVAGFTVNTIRPTAVLSHTPADVTSVQDVDIIVGGTDVQTYSYSLNGSQWSDFISVSQLISRSDLIDGVYTVQVKGKNSAGNEQAVATEYTWKVSTDKPVAVLNNAPAKYVKNRSLYVTITGTNVYYYRYQLNGGSWSESIPIDQPISITNMGDGDYTMKVAGSSTANDTATEGDPVTWTWTVDNVTPTALLSNLPLPLTNAQSTHITVDSADGDVVGYKYILIAGGNPGQISGQYSVTAPIELTALPQNTYTIKVMGIDAAGNIQSEASATEWSWTVDIVSPRATLLDPPTANTNNNNVDITVNGSGSYAYKYMLDGGSWSPEILVNNHFIRNNMADGYHTLTVITRDEAGNWQSIQDPTEHVWQIDTVPPVAVISEKPASVTNVQNARFAVGGVGVVKYQYRLKYGTDPWTDWSVEFDRIQDPYIVLPDSNLTSPFSSNFIDGEYKIEVLAIDKAFNKQAEADATSYTWVVDQNKPTAQLRSDTLPELMSMSDDINITVEGVVSYKYLIDGNDFGSETAVSTAIVINNLSEGSHTIKVIGKNALGLWQSSDEATTFEWVIDETPPMAELSNKPLSVTSSQSADFNVGGIGIYSYKYSIDNPDPRSSTEIYVNTDDTITLSNLGGGSHTIYVIARDEAGNWQEYTQATSYTWTIDTTEPVLQFITATLPANPTKETTAAISIGGTGVVSFKYKLDTGSWSGELTIGTLISRVGLTAGSHTIYAIGKSSAGVWQGVPAEYSWVIDVSAPSSSDITLAGLPGNPTSDESFTITVGGTGITHYHYKIAGSWVGPIPVATKITGTTISGTTYNLEVLGVDAAGNTTPESDSKKYTWFVDTNSPVAAITNRPDNPSSSNDAAFIIAGTDIHQYRYKLDSDVSYSSWIDISTNIVLDDLADGSHTISVQGRKSENDDHINDPMFEQVDPTVYTWVIDTSAPVVKLSNLPVDQTTSNSVNITVGSDAGDVVAYRYRLNNGSWIPSDSTEIVVDFPLTLSGLAVQTHKIEIVGRDSAGNWSVVTAASTHTWTIKYPPLVSPKTYDGGTNTSSPTLLFTWIRPGSTADVKIKIASDSEFNNVIEEKIIGNVDSYEYIFSSTETQTYYARVSVNAESGKSIDDSTWKEYGDGSDGINVTGGVKGVVLNALGFAKVTGATVELKTMVGSQLQATTSTDENGEFAFSNVKLGTNFYQLTVSAGSTFNPTGKGNVTVALGEVTDVGNLFVVPTSATDGSLKGKTVDANTGYNVSGATVQILSWENVLMDTKTSAANGTFQSIVLPAGVYSVVMSKTGYFDLRVDNNIINGADPENIGGVTDIENQALCEVLLEPQVRVIVLWGETPNDLDLHLVGPTAKTVTDDNTGDDPVNRFHTYWSNQKTYNEGTGTHSPDADWTGTAGTASLVQDDTSSYGPEAMNIFRYGGAQYAYGVYTYSLHRYSNNSGTWGTAPITMRVYDSQGMVREINFPSSIPSGDPRYWKALKITVNGNSRDKRSLRVVNQFDNLTYSSKLSMDW